MALIPGAFLMLERSHSHGTMAASVGGWLSLSSWSVFQRVYCLNNASVGLHPVSHAVCNKEPDFPMTEVILEFQMLVCAIDRTAYRVGSCGADADDGIQELES
jgi:hypothetical protein